MKNIGDDNYTTECIKKITKYFSNEYQDAEVSSYQDYYTNLYRKVSDDVKTNINDEVSLMKVISRSYDFLCSTIYEQDLEDVSVTELEFAIFAKKLYEIFKEYDITSEFHANLLRVLCSTIAHAIVYNLNITLQLLDLEVKVITMENKSKAKSGIITTYYKDKNKTKKLVLNN